MPFIVTLHPTETVDIQVEETDSLDELYAALNARIPDEFAINDIWPSQNRGRARRTGTREMTIEGRSDLATSIPEGWQALSIRAE
ncbi:hypothetical protein [Microbacterium gubbeenense]|uniref:hypothetical protein n=1 Tax=Microbacterium gubbeenense TaxID=159896 RepID=UPI000491D703|nr:hypothetical protein [Microbacterium gubbeenense]